MVCLGNICRSPLAEGILRSKVSGKDVIVDSAGTSGWHIGEPPDERSVEVAEKNGVDLSGQFGRQFTVEDFDRFDKIYAMDMMNYRNVLALARNKADEQKVEMLLNVLYPGEDREVPDPYYGGAHGFQQVYDMLDKACDVIAANLKDD